MAETEFDQRLESGDELNVLLDNQRIFFTEQHWQTTGLDGEDAVARGGIEYDGANYSVEAYVAGLDGGDESPELVIVNPSLGGFRFLLSDVQLEKDVQTEDRTQTRLRWEAHSIDDVQPESAPRRGE